MVRFTRGTLPTLHLENIQCAILGPTVSRIIAIPYAQMMVTARAALACGRTPSPYARKPFCNQISAHSGALTANRNSGSNSDHHSEINRSTSNGPNLKIRGSASQIFERYVALAREAAIGGDRVAAENFYQHAEHYFRAAKESREGNQQGTPPRPTTPADVEMSPAGTAASTELRDGDGDRSQAQWDSDSDDRSSVDSSTH